MVARLLKERGWDVEVFLFGEAEKLPPDARVNYERWVRDRVHHSDALAGRFRYPGFDADRADIDLFVDAGFGTGLTRGLPQELIDVFFALNDREEPRDGRGWIVAVDMPSGLCADSGRVLGDDVEAVCFADLTVTFHRAKRGHYLDHGPECCGKLVVRDIGL